MNKEQIYDSKIAPLMEQIINICKEHKIGMFATYEIPNEEDADLKCTTILPDETGKNSPIITQLYRTVRDGSIVPPMHLTVKKPDGSEIHEVILG